VGWGVVDLLEEQGQGSGGLGAVGWVEMHGDGVGGVGDGAGQA
jgi:hypothetical protein